MEGISKLFRGKENRAMIHELAENVEAAIMASILTDRDQDIPVLGRGCIDKFSVMAHADENRYLLFKGPKVMATVWHCDKETAMEIITCAIIAFLGMKEE